MGVLDHHSGDPAVHRDTPLGHLGCLDLDVIDFGCVLGAPCESLSGSFGDICLPLDTQMDCRIRWFFSNFVRNK